jgi:hypothetical protein
MSTAHIEESIHGQDAASDKLEGPASDDLNE